MWIVLSIGCDNGLILVYTPLIKRSVVVLSPGVGTIRMEGLNKIWVGPYIEQPPYKVPYQRIKEIERDRRKEREREMEKRERERECV